MKVSEEGEGGRKGGRALLQPSLAGWQLGAFPSPPPLDAEVPTASQQPHRMPHPLLGTGGLGQGDENGFGHEHGYGNGHGHGHRHEGDWESVTPPDASMEDPFQIHTMTEFKVERHNV